MSIFNYFCDIFLLQKTKDVSIYRWCLQIFSYNLLEIGCFKIVQSYIEFRLVFREIWKRWEEGGSNWSFQNKLSTPPALLGYHIQADCRIFWFEFIKQYQLKQEVLKFVGSKDEYLGPCLWWSLFAKIIYSLYQYHRCFTAKNTRISPNLLVWNAQCPQVFERIAWNSAETVRFHKISTPRN